MMLFKAMTLKEAKDLYNTITMSCLDKALKLIMQNDLLFFTNNFERDYGTSPKKVEYYGEIYEKTDSMSYVIQSKWFDTAEQVEQWFQTMDFVIGDFGQRIMFAEWDETADSCGDIEIYREIL